LAFEEQLALLLDHVSAMVVKGDILIIGDEQGIVSIIGTSSIKIE